MVRRVTVGLLFAACIALGAPPGAAQQVAATIAAEPAGFVPVAIWELRREGHPTVRHAWVTGTESMLRVSWDAGATWYGFRLLYAESARGMLALKVLSREELGRGEITWKDQALLTIVRGQVGSVTLMPGEARKERVDLAFELLSVEDVAPSAIGAAEVEVGGDGGGEVLDGGGGGGATSCCAHCGDLTVCNCSVCIPACHASCCRAGCFCLPC